MGKQYLDKYDSDMLADIVNSLHARIQSDATTPSKATKEYFESKLDEVVDKIDTRIISIEAKFDEHVKGEEKYREKNDKDIKPILDSYKNVQGFWYVSTIIFVSVVGMYTFFFSLKPFLLKLLSML